MKDDVTRGSGKNPARRPHPRQKVPRAAGGDGTRMVSRQIPKVVVHPRYGDTVVATGCRAPGAEVLAAFRGIEAIEIFVESAIRADPRLQNFAWTEPRLFYADLLKRCEKCRRRYLFFAREQRFWYEELKINVATPSRYCCECAAENRELAAALERFRATPDLATLATEDLVVLGNDLVRLFQAGLFKNRERLTRVRSLLKKRAVPVEKWTALRDFLGTDSAVPGAAARSRKNRGN